MKAEERGLVRSTWIRAGATREFAMELFYAVLFKIDPDTRRLFPEAGRERALRFRMMINLLVGGYGEGSLHGSDAGDARDHAALRDLFDRHFGAARVALLRALHQTLGADYTAHVETAWVRAMEDVAAGFRRAPSVNPLPAARRDIVRVVAPPTRRRARQFGRLVRP